MFSRRFSLFRHKLSQSSNENFKIEALHQVIVQLRYDLQIRNGELEAMKRHVETKGSSSAQHSNESIEQAIQLQTVLNSRLEEMLIENDSFKRNIRELELFTKQGKSKRQFHFFVNS